ncbi:hypothetical protein INT48_004495, partial [Thamnidium elegans]
MKKTIRYQAKDKSSLKLLDVIGRLINDKLAVFSKIVLTNILLLKVQQCQPVITYFKRYTMYNEEGPSPHLPYHSNHNESSSIQDRVFRQLEMEPLGLVQVPQDETVAHFL